MPESNIYSSLSAALPNELTFSIQLDAGSDSDASYVDITIKDSPGTENVLEGMTFDGYCIDTDRGISTNTDYTAKVYSSYETLPDELIGAGLIENPDNLDLVNWILNQGFEGQASTGNGTYTSGDIQRAIWALLDDQQSSGGLGSWDQARVDEILSLAQSHGEGFVPSYDYTTLFGEQVIGKMGVILVPDTNNDGLPDNQIVIAEVELSKIGDTVWSDCDADGIQDGSETGMAGVTVNLLADIDGDGVIEEGEVVDTTTTDANGNYEFTTIAGEYKVQFEQPEHKLLSPTNQGSDDTVDSDGLISDVITLAPGENDTTVDAGFYHPPSFQAALPKTLTFSIQLDAGSDPDASYVDITIKDIPGTDNIFEGMTFDGYCLDTDRPINQNVDYTAKVYSSGEPLPDELIGPGLIEKPENLDLVNWILNQNFEGKDSTDDGTYTSGDVQRAIWELLDDQQSTGGLGAWEQGRVDEILTLAQFLGEGFVPEYDYTTIFNEQVVGKIGLILVPDTDGDCLPDKQIVIAEVELSKLGDTVWLDSDADGIQDAGEAGIAGVTVNLFADIDGDGVFEQSEVVQTTTTDANGNYEFSVIPGEYQVEFEQPDGYEVSPANQGGDDAVDSDGLVSDVVSLAPGENDPTIDSGFYQLASLGDFVFEDTNGNGVQDTGESGIPDATVELYTCVDGQPDVFVTSTTTDASGNYEFTDLEPGEYIVKFITPDGYTQTQANVGNDATDSDAGVGGLTGCYKLSSGENNDTVDAGFIPDNPDITVEKFVRVDENPIALKKLVAVEPINAGEEGLHVCETEGKPEEMVFEYNPSVSFDTQQDSDKGSALVNGTLLPNGVIDDDGTSYIVVTDDNDYTDGISGKVFFAGTVAEGEQFSASIFNANTDKFESNTYFYFFDDQGGPLLQSAKYHTSCSAPIILGDGILSATLVGYQGVDGNSLISLPSPTFVDANDAPGPETLIGTTVEFRYEVSNTGDSEISNVVLTDDRIANVTYVEGDTDNDNNLDTNETWIYSATEVAGEGLITNKGTVIGIVNGQTTIAMDMANYTGVEAPAGDIGSEGQHVCETEGKPEEMVFAYNPSVSFDTQQDSGKGSALVNGTLLPNGSIDDDGTSYIVVTDDNDYTDGISGKVFFAGTVAEGEQFSASIFNANTDKFESNTYFYFFDDQGGPLLQSAKYHTSCSAPIILGDGILSATLVGYDGVNGSMISLPTPTEPVEPPTSNTQIELPQVDVNFDVNNIGVTGDTAPGIIAERGDIVTFTFQVKNTGNVDLTLNDLVDDNATPDDPSDDFTPTYVTGDDGDNVFNPGETWYFQAKEIADRPGLNTNTIKVKATDGNGTMVMADDPANYLINPLDIEKSVAVEPSGGAAEGQHVCETEGKPEEMVFEYNPSVTFDTQQDSGKGSALVNGTLLPNGSIDDDGTSYIVVTDDSDYTDGISGKVFFAGTVAEGQQFSASIFNANTDKFESNTYFYVFDDQGGPLLQSAKYHTSCSAPIILGDGILSATLVGYDGVNGDMVALPSPTFVDADTLDTAPEAIMGTEVKYQYVVRNLGTEALSNVTVSDDQLGTPTYIEGDTNNNNLLDADEEWIYTATETAVKGDRTNIATATADLNGVALSESDAANYVGIKPPAPTGDLEDLFGKPTQMTFTYIGGNLISTGGKDHDGDGFGDQDGNAKIEDGSNPTGDDDSSAYIVVSQTKNIDDIKDGSKPTLFAGTVEIGESFSADIDFLNQDKFENDTRISIFDSEADFIAGNEALQVIKYKTDGSQDMLIGDIIAGVQLVEYTGQTGGYDDPELDVDVQGQIGAGFSLYDVLGAAQSLTFSYSDTNNDGIAGGVDIVTGGQDDKATISGFQDDDLTAYFLVSNKSDPFDSGAKIYFQGEINLNESFTASLDFQGADKFDKDTRIHLFDDLAAYNSGSSALQTMKYKTDGSEPMLLEDQLGGLTLTGYASTSGLAAMI